MAGDRVLITLDLSPAGVRHLRHALQDHAAGLRRNGLPVPGELAGLAARLTPRNVTPPETREARSRRLAAERTRRWRARQRGDQVPLRRHGRPENVTDFAA